MNRVMGPHHQTPPKNRIKQAVIELWTLHFTSNLNFLPFSTLPLNTDTSTTTTNTNISLDLFLRLLLFLILRATSWAPSFTAFRREVIYPPCPPPQTKHSQSHNLTPPKNKLAFAEDSPLSPSKSNPSLPLPLHGLSEDQSLCLPWENMLALP